MGLEHTQLLVLSASWNQHPPPMDTKVPLYFQNNICIMNDFSIFQCDILARNENISIVDGL